MTATVYSKPACVQCDSTYRKMNKDGIIYRSIDVTKDQEAYEYITQDLGYQQVPVVVTEDGNHWSGFRPDEISALKENKVA